MASAAETPLEARALTGRRACSRRARRAVAGIGVCDAHVADLAVVEHVDRAPVGEPRHRELDQLGERVLQVERLRQNDAGLGQERERLLALAVLGEVEERGDRGHDLAARVAHGLGAERDDAVRSVGADDGDLAAGRSTRPPARRWMSSACGPAIERSDAPCPSSSWARWFVNSSLRDEVSAMITPSGSWRTSAASRSCSPCASW